MSSADVWLLVSAAALVLLAGLFSAADAALGSFSQARAAELGQKARALEAMRATLLDLARRCHGDARPDCPILDELGRE